MPFSNRRHFLKSASVAASAASLGVFTSGSTRAKAQSPNDRAKIAVIGCGGQGTGDGWRALEFADVVAVCDC